MASQDLGFARAFISLYTEDVPPQWSGASRIYAINDPGTAVMEAEETADDRRYPEDEPDFDDSEGVDFSQDLDPDDDEDDGADEEEEQEDESPTDDDAAEEEEEEYSLRFRVLSPTQVERDYTVEDEAEDEEFGPTPEEIAMEVAFLEELEDELDPEDWDEICEPDDREKDSGPPSYPILDWPFNVRNSEYF